MAGVEGRVALVTGAGSAEGIGFASARLLRAKGAKVAITSTTDRIFERLENLNGGHGETFRRSDTTVRDGFDLPARAVPAEFSAACFVSFYIENKLFRCEVVVVP